MQLIWKKLFEDDRRLVGETATPSVRSGEERHVTHQLGQRSFTVDGHS